VRIGIIIKIIVDMENALNEILCVSRLKSLAVLRGLTFFYRRPAWRQTGLRKEAAKSPREIRKLLGIFADSHIISSHN